MLRSRSCFALLFRRHASGIGRYCRPAALGPGPAEDIVAETFLAAFRAADRLRRGPA